MVVVLLIIFRQKVQGIAEHFGAFVPVVFGECINCMLLRRSRGVVWLR